MSLAVEGLETKLTLSTVPVTLPALPVPVLGPGGRPLVPRNPSPPPPNQMYKPYDVTMTTNPPSGSGGTPAEVPNWSPYEGWTYDEFNDAVGHMKPPPLAGSPNPAGVPQVAPLPGDPAPRPAIPDPNRPADPLPIMFPGSVPVPDPASPPDGTVAP